MSNYLVSDTDLTSVANAIRAKSGGESQLAFPAGFVSEIEDIPSGGGGVQSITFLDWINYGITSSSGVISKNTSRCLCTHGLYKFLTMAVPNGFDYAIFASNFPSFRNSNRIYDYQGSYIGGWTGSSWAQSLTWHNGGVTVDLTALTNWSNYILIPILRNHNSDTDISTSEGNNVQFSYNPSTGAFAL